VLLRGEYRRQLGVQARARVGEQRMVDVSGVSKVFRRWVLGRVRILMAGVNKTTITTTNLIHP